MCRRSITVPRSKPRPWSKMSSSGCANGRPCHDDRGVRTGAGRLGVMVLPGRSWCRCPRSRRRGGRGERSDRSCRVTSTVRTRPRSGAGCTCGSL
jgi:hypothetical protein